jgi:hypothetical protein
MDELDNAIVNAVRNGNRTMRELLPYLAGGGFDVSQNTISRRLKELVADQRVRVEGSGRATAYRYDDYQDYFSVPGSQRKAVAYNPRFVEDYIPDETTWFSAEDIELMKEAGGGRQMDASTYSRSIAQKLLVDLAYASSSMEGNTYSYLDTEVLVQYGKVASGKEAAETQMILNHKDAINYLIDNIADIEIDVREVKTMHALLSYGLIDPRQVGTVRQHIVGVGNSAYAPLSIPARLDEELAKIVDKGAKIGDPFEQSLFLMTMISYLQYFVDVNKRTGRLTANIPLLKAGMAPLSFLNMDKTEYTRGLLSFYELGRTDVIAAAYRQGYLASASRYDAYVGRDQHLIEVEARYRPEKAAAVREYVLKSLDEGAKLGRDFFDDWFGDVVDEDRDTLRDLVWQNIDSLQEGNHVVFGISRKKFDDYSQLPEPGHGHAL